MKVKELFEVLKYTKIEGKDRTIIGFGNIELIIFNKCNIEKARSHVNWFGPQNPVYWHYYKSSANAQAASFGYPIKTNIPKEVLDMEVICVDYINNNRINVYVRGEEEIINNICNNSENGFRLVE